MKPTRLAVSFHEKIWGTTELQPWFPRREKKIGEVWFTHAPELPLLVKFLFTSDRLSVQVHPADTDGERGKTEMWHILRAEPGAAIALGFRQPVTRERLREAALSGEIEQLLNWIPVQAGETYYTPAHTVHAIGAGVALCEIQQQSDITYRLYDYGRPRELHLDKAVAISDLGCHPGAVIPRDAGQGRRVLVECPQFVTESLRLSGAATYPPPAHSFDLLITLEGQGTIAGAPFRPGEVWLIDGGGSEFELKPAGSARFLRTYVPPPNPFQNVLADA